MLYLKQNKKNGCFLLIYNLHSTIFEKSHLLLEEGEFIQRKITIFILKNKSLKTKIESRKSLLVFNRFYCSPNSLDSIPEP